MAPACRSRAKYNYSEETRNGQSPCQYCGKIYRPQSIKQHEASCKSRQLAAKARERCNK
ncbi:hypothetical protein PAXRUDRAFT_203565, partial [Paxillus rubicundulus Ve08.2h10]